MAKLIGLGALVLNSGGDFYTQLLFQLQVPSVHTYITASGGPCLSDLEAVFVEAL